MLSFKALSSHLLAVAGVFAAVQALPNKVIPRGNERYSLETRGINYTVFNHVSTAASLSYVTNSGICETTPGVNQYSGYLSVGTLAYLQRHEPGKVGSYKQARA